MKLLTISIFLFLGMFNYRTGALIIKSELERTGKEATFENCYNPFHKLNSRLEIPLLFLEWVGMAFVCLDLIMVILLVVGVDLYKYLTNQSLGIILMISYPLSTVATIIYNVTHPQKQ